VSPHHLHWNGGDITAAVLIVAYVVYLVVSIARSRKSLPTSDAGRRSSIGIDHRGGKATYDDTNISGMDKGVQQTDGELRSKGLIIDGEPYGETEEGLD